MAKIAIIGGGVIGSSIAYYLALAGHAADAVVIEPDPTYEFAATPRATGGIRQLFTVPENIRMAQYGHEIYGQFETLMAVDGDPAPIDFHREGYLWLGSGKQDIDSLIANWRIQTAHDARVELLDRKGVKHRFPSMRVDDIDIAAFSPDDGYMDPHSVLMGFRRKAVSLGIRYLKDRVVDFEVAGKRVAGVRLESGERLATESVVNAANCWGPELCDKLGMKVPVAPMRRLTFYFEIREKLETMPLTRHISRNVSFRPQGAGYISGNTRYDEPPGFNWEIDYPVFRRGDLAGPGRARPGLRSAQDDQRLGRPLRPEQLRQQRHPRALDRRAGQFPYRPRLFRPWADAGAGGRPRPERIAAARPLPDPRPVAARLSAHPRRHPVA